MKQEEQALAKLPQGFEKFANKCKEHLASAAHGMLCAQAHAYELGKEIAVFAASKDVKTEVDGRNKARKDAKLGGAPQTYHGFICGLLDEANVCKKAWGEKCFRAYDRDRESGFKIGPKLAMVIAKGGLSSLGEHNPLLENDILPNPESLIPAQKNETADLPKPTFKDFVRGFTAKLDALGHKVGQPALVNKRNQEQWADALTEWWRARGVHVEITFTGGKSK